SAPPRTQGDGDARARVDLVAVYLLGPATAADIRMILLPVLGAVLFSSAAATKAEPPPVFEGTWIVTLGTQMVFHGRWAAQALPDDRDTVQGSFSMLNDAGEVVGGGTWSARRAKRGFQGKWSSRGANGATYTGSFDAHLPGFKGKTLEDMF